jgi:predicted RND superfamily exporter protein
MLTEFRGIREFGFIAGVSILMAFLAMMTLLPALLVLLRGRAARARAPRPGTDAAQEGVPWLERLARHPMPILAATALLTAYSLTALRTVRFDYNRLNLQAKGTESVIWERRIMASGRSGFAALTTADSLPELRAKRSAFEALPGVDEVVSLLTLIPAEQEAKIALIRTLAPAVAHIQLRREPEVDLGAVRGALDTLRGRLELGVREADPGATADTLRSALTRAEGLLGRLESPEAGALTPRLAAVQARLRDDFVAKLDRLQENLDPRPLTVRELPDELTRKFVARNGRLLMRIYPAIDTWDRDGAREFVTQLRSVDPAVTGSPVVSYEASRLMEAAYFYGTFSAFAVVGVLAVVMLRRPLDTLLGLTPLALGTLWTIGAMQAVGLPFNLANVWGLPLIVGAAAEFGLNVTLRYREGGGGPVVPRSIATSVFLNGLTTLAGFGSLMVGRHQGIFGLGLLLSIGTAAGLISSLVILPALLRLLGAGKAGRWQPHVVALKKDPEAATPTSRGAR